MLDCKAGSRNFLGDVMAMRVRLLLSSVVLLSAMWLISCGHYTCGTTFGNSSCTAGGGGLQQGGGNNISVTAFVYFVDITAGQIAAEGLNVANSQTFHPLSTFVSPPLNSGGEGGMAVVNKQFLYIAGNTVLDGFSIDGTTGGLSTLTDSPHVGISGLTIAADPQGRFLFVGGAGVIYAFTVNVDGTLTAAPTSPFAYANGTPTQLVTDGVGKYLYALNGSTITAYSYNQTNGALSTIGSPFSAGMSMIASEKTGTYLLGITGATSEISVFTIGSTGALSGGSQSPTGLPPIFLEVSPNGKFVYTFNQTDFSPQAPSQPMEGYGFNAGALTALTGSPFTGLDASLGRFDQSGEFLFSVQHISNTTESGEFAYGVDINGLVTSTLPNYQAPNDVYGVTDAP